MRIEDKDPPEARFIDAKGSEQIVQPVGFLLRPGNVFYNRYIHEGNIKCPCCEAPTRLQEGSASVGGSSAKGRDSYFTPVEKHDGDCILPLRRAPSSVAQKIDRTKGYRVHINTREFSSEFSEKSGVYEISEGGRMTINDDDLRDREAYTLNDLADFMKFRKHCEDKRWDDTWFIFGNKKIHAKDFLVSSDPENLAALSNRAAARQQGEAPPFCILHVRTTQPFTLGRWDITRPAPIDKVLVGRDDRGSKRYVRPGAFIDDKTNTGTGWAFWQAGDYLVMGVARHNRWEGDYATIDSVNVKITDKGQVLSVNKENLELLFGESYAPPAGVPQKPRPPRGWNPA